MDRLKLGKINTEFYSKKGNTLFKRIWLENDLDEEMIFSSWIGPSKALVRQKVSDYVQNYLHDRSFIIAPRNYQLLEEDEIIHNNGIEITVERRNHKYYDDYVQTILQQNYKRREAMEKARIARCISSGHLPPIPGFEYVVQSPVFRAKEMERRITKLSRIPLPFNEDQFNEHILPILVDTSGISERKQCHRKTSPSDSQFYKDILPNEISSHYASSELSDDSSLPDKSHVSKEVKFDYDMNPKREESNFNLNCSCDKQSNECDCFQDMKHHLNAEIEEDIVLCSCMSKQLWDDDDEQTACSLYEKSASFLKVYIREHLISEEYMEEYYTKNWMNK